MINEVCNQRCSYCFASEFVNKKRNDMSFLNFKKAVDFICTAKQFNRVGVIGGEPLLHPQFDKFISYLENNEKVKRFVVFTNGVFLLDHKKCIESKKVGILINVNSPLEVGENNYKKTVEAIDYIVNNDDINKLTIGLNIFSPDLDYSFFTSLAEKYDFKMVRLSIVVPAYDKEKNGLLHFYRLKQKTLEIVKKLLVKGTAFNFDCNVPVRCLWDDEELEDLKLMGLTGDKKRLIPIEESLCHPVIDILPDLTAIRCFGLSDKTKVSIRKFKTIDDLRDYYVKHFDEDLSKNPLDDKCLTCEMFAKKCYGGCLANRRAKNEETK